MRKRAGTLACLAIGGGAVGLAVAAFGPGITACTTHQCDQSSYDWPPAVDGGPGGFMQTEDLYVSNDINSTWLNFHGNTTVRLWFPPEVAGRKVEVPRVFVGTDDAPNAPFAMDAGVNYTGGVGQLGTFNDLRTFSEPTLVDGGGRTYRAGGEVSITNTSCATYFLHVEMTVDPPAEAGVEGSD